MEKHQMRRHCGFTLVELLVVIAIIGILVSLLLPAIQAARAAARRTQCKNNVKQLGLALHNYHDTHKSLPPGHLETGTTGRTFRHHFSWMAYILPYMEQEHVHDRIDFNLGYSAPENREAASTSISTFICPSDPVVRIPSRPYWGITNYWAPTNYLGNQGIDCQCRFERCSGIFGHSTFTRLSQITDGTSETIAIGETLKGDLDVSSLEDNYIYARRGGGVGANAQDVDTCQGLAPNASDRATKWLGGHPQHNLLNTSRGPNDLRFDCKAPHNGCSNFSARSAHVGGVHVGMADASVQFISNSVDVTVFRALGTRRGNEAVGQY